VFVGLLLAACSVPLARAATGAVIDINTREPSPIPGGFSGFNSPELRNGIEYYDPKYIAVVKPLRPGCLRFPAGLASMAFDWSTGYLNPAWVNALVSGGLVSPQTANLITQAQQLTQAKGGVRLSDFATFASTLNARAIICINAYTDTNPSSATSMALAAQSAGLNVAAWELANEAYLFPLIFPTAASYALSMQEPYFTGITSAVPTALVGLSYQGQFSGTAGDFSVWDSSLAAYTPRYWNAVSVHVYPITSILAPQQAMQTLNGVLAHGTAEFINSYLVPLAGAGTPVFITEFNCCTQASDKFLMVLYNGIFLAEYIARMSSVPNVKAVGIHSLYSNNNDNHGVIRAMDDYVQYLTGQVAANPGYSTDTATNPDTQYQFYTAAPGVALQIANRVVNSSTYILPTMVTGGSMVPILGYDGQPVPALYAQAYWGQGGTPGLLITNKSGTAQTVTVKLNGVNLHSPLRLAYVSNTNPAIANTKLAPNNVQIQTSTASNPFSVGPYSVTSATW
jgi:hypothetical protein